MLWWVNFIVRHLFDWVDVYGSATLEFVRLVSLPLPMKRERP